MNRIRARLELVDSAGWAQRHDARGIGKGPSSSAAQFELQLEERVLALRASALTSRSFAAGYVERASRSLAEARPGENGTAGSPREDHLSEAGRASRQARKCLRFARLCERRASSLTALARSRGADDAGSL